ncbi:hypothetical protein HKX48_008148 [Thoreauomyces humboldtii]|nr:hypothetical protein HKX48_008148 [Thoreauomyces humboldtii]
MNGRPLAASIDVIQATSRMKAVPFDTLRDEQATDRISDEAACKPKVTLQEHPQNSGVEPIQPSTMEQATNVEAKALRAQLTKLSAAFKLQEQAASEQLESHSLSMGAAGARITEIIARADALEAELSCVRAKAINADEEAEQGRVNHLKIASALQRALDEERAAAIVAEATGRRNLDDATVNHRRRVQTLAEEHNVLAANLNVTKAAHRECELKVLDLSRRVATDKKTPEASLLKEAVQAPTAQAAQAALDKRFQEQQCSLLSSQTENIRLQKLLEAADREKADLLQQVQELRIRIECVPLHDEKVCPLTQELAVAHEKCNVLETNVSGLQAELSAAVKGKEDLGIDLARSQKTLEELKPQLAAALIRTSELETAGRAYALDRQLAAEKAVEQIRHYGSQPKESSASEQMTQTPTTSVSLPGLAVESFAMEGRPAVADKRCDATIVTVSPIKSCRSREEACPLAAAPQKANTLRRRVPDEPQKPSHVTDIPVSVADPVPLTTVVERQPWEAVDENRTSIPLKREISERLDQALPPLPGSTDSKDSGCSRVKLLEARVERHMEEMAGKEYELLKCRSELNIALEQIEKLESCHPGVGQRSLKSRGSSATASGKVMPKDVTSAQMSKRASRDGASSTRRKSSYIDRLPGASSTSDGVIADATMAGNEANDAPVVLTGDLETALTASRRKAQELESRLERMEAERKGNSACARVLEDHLRALENPLLGYSQRTSLPSFPDTFPNFESGNPQNETEVVNETLRTLLRRTGSSLSLPVEDPPGLPFPLEYLGRNGSTTSLGALFAGHGSRGQRRDVHVSSRAAPVRSGPAKDSANMRKKKNFWWTRHVPE